jgi:peptidoglycan LD-endopeptidase CwlK
MAESPSASVMKLSERDRAALIGVHPDLVRVIHHASEHTFLSWFINEGVRTPARQRILLEAGRTMTLDSPHLARATVVNGASQQVCHAVDLVLRNKNGADWVFEHYFALAAEILESAARLRVPVRWGGHFRNRRGARFADGLFSNSTATFIRALTSLDRLKEKI